MGETQSTLGEPHPVYFFPPVKTRGGQNEVDNIPTDPGLVKPKDEQAMRERYHDEIDSPLVTSPPKKLGSKEDSTS